MLTLPDKTIILKPGDHYTLEPGTNHTFSSNEGAIVEEISTHDSMSDSFFTDKKVIIGLPIEDD